jgi:hypothetical protein
LQDAAWCHIVILSINTNVIVTAPARVRRLRAPAISRTSAIVGRTVDGKFNWRARAADRRSDGGRSLFLSRHQPLSRMAA